MKIEQRRKQECQIAKCGLDKSRCLVKHGTSCIKNGGTKIPVQSAMPNRMQREETQTNGMKSYFIVDGAATYEGREY